MVSNVSKELAFSIIRAITAFPAIYQNTQHHILEDSDRLDQYFLVGFDFDQCILL
jgi:hypothetical protein